MNGRSESVTYIFFDGEFIKIGQSSSLDGVLARLASCQTGNARKLEVIGITKIAEQEVHKRFSVDRVQGEWFKLSVDVLKFIASPEVRGVRVTRSSGKLKLLPQWV